MALKLFSFCSHFFARLFLVQCWLSFFSHISNTLDGFMAVLGTLFIRGFAIICHLPIS